MYNQIFMKPYTKELDRVVSKLDSRMIYKISNSSVYFFISHLILRILNRLSFDNFNF